MKYITFILSVIASLGFTSTLIACPTCIGRTQRDAPPFFRNELYEWRKKQRKSAAIEHLIRHKQRKQRNTHQARQLIKKNQASKKGASS